MTHPGASRFLTTYLGSVLLLAFLYCCVVTAVDPRRNFFGSPMPQVTPNTRRLKIELFEKYNSQRQVTGLILGTSRSMLLPPERADRLTGLRFFNSGVFSALPEDHLALFRLYRDLRAAPRLLIVGIDDIELASGTAAAPELEANYLLQSHLRPAGPAFWHYLELYGQSFHVQTTMDLITSARLALHPREPLYNWEPNGRLVYGKWNRQIREGAFDHTTALEENLAETAREYRSFGGISQPHVEALRHLLQEAEASQARVILWFTPVHPAVRERLNHIAGLAAFEGQARNQVWEAATRYHAAVRDLSDPASFGAGDADFYDGVHMRGEIADRMLDLVLKTGDK